MEVVVPVVRPAVVTEAPGVRVEDAVVEGWGAKRAGREDR